MKKSKTTNLNLNTSAALAYIVLMISGIIIAASEKDHFPRFHALQSIIFSTIWMLILIILPIFDVNWILIQIINFGFIILWIAIILKAYQGQMTKIPFIGNIAEELSRKY